MNERSLYRFLYELEKENSEGFYNELINEKKKEVRQMNKKTNPWVEVTARLEKRVFSRLLTKEEKETIITQKTIPSSQSANGKICTAWINFFTVEGKTICYHAIRLNV